MGSDLVVKMAIEQVAKQKPTNISRPLAGRCIVVTRARSQSGSLAQRIEELGGEVIEFPTIEIQPPETYAPLDKAIRRINTYNWLIFTSVNGVDQFLTRMRTLQKSLSEIHKIKVGAIGPETAKKLAEAGIQPCLVPKKYQAEGILELLAPGRVRGTKVLIPRAAKARDVLPETLRQWGAQVDIVEAYRTVPPKTDVSQFCALLRKRKIDMITFTSSSTVSNLVQILNGQDLAELLAGVAVACIGPITKKTVEDLGMRANVVSEEFTIRGLVRAIVEYFSKNGTKATSAGDRSPKA